MEIEKWGKETSCRPILFSKKALHEVTASGQHISQFQNILVVFDLNIH